VALGGHLLLEAQLGTASAAAQEATAQQVPAEVRVHALSGMSALGFAKGLPHAALTKVSTACDNMFDCLHLFGGLDAVVGGGGLQAGNTSQHSDWNLRLLGGGGFLSGRCIHIQGV
jgi:hypothetical protein